MKVGELSPPERRSKLRRQPEALRRLISRGSWRNRYLPYGQLDTAPQGNFAASTSTFSMDGGAENSSPAFAIRAAATLPERCACRPASSGKASKIPKVVGPRRIPNHAVVAGSSMTSGRPLMRKFSTALSFPAFASRRTNNATLTMSYPLSLERDQKTTRYVKARWSSRAPRTTIHALGTLSDTRSPPARACAAGSWVCATQSNYRPGCSQSVNSCVARRCSEIQGRRSLAIAHASLVECEPPRSRNLMPRLRAHQRNIRMNSQRERLMFAVEAVVVAPVQAAVGHHKHV